LATAFFISFCDVCHFETKYLVLIQTLALKWMDVSPVNISNIDKTTEVYSLDILLKYFGKNSVKLLD
jgi:hypothetical protein